MSASASFSPICNPLRSFWAAGVFYLFPRIGRAFTASPWELCKCGRKSQTAPAYSGVALLFAARPSKQRHSRFVNRASE
jgi:hypothetical protein